MKTALLLIDVINDFFHPEGRNYHPEYEPTLKNILILLDAARTAGCPIVHVMEGHRHIGNDFEWKKLPPHCFIGDFDAEPLAQLKLDKQREYILRKRRFSAFFETDLDLLLREAEVGRLVIAGVKTNVCIRATAQDAFGYGYEVFIPREAVNSNYPHLHESSLEDIYRYMGQVISLEEVIKMLQG